MVKPIFLGTLNKLTKCVFNEHEFRWKRYCESEKCGQVADEQIC